MKKVHFFLLASALICLGTWSCKKDNPSPDVLKLYDMPLFQVKSLITGQWQIRKSHYSFCGVAGCYTGDSVYQAGRGDLVSFLANDTIKWTSFDGSFTAQYAKASIQRQKNWGGNGNLWVSDSVYAYQLPNAISPIFVGEMKKDTLIVLVNVGYHYMTRK